MTTLSYIISGLFLVVGTVLGWLLKNKILYRKYLQIQGKHEELHALHMNLEHELVSIRQKMHQKDDACRRMESQFDELKSMADRGNQLEQNYQTLQEKFEALQIENEENLGILTESQTEISQILQIKSSLEGEKAALEAEINSLETAIGPLKSENESLKQNLSKTKTQIILLQKQLEKAARETPLKSTESQSTDKFGQRARQSRDSTPRNPNNRTKPELAKHPARSPDFTNPSEPKFPNSSMNTKEPEVELAPLRDPDTAAPDFPLPEILIPDKPDISAEADENKDTESGIKTDQPEKIGFQASTLPSHPQNITHNQTEAFKARPKAKVKPPKSIELLSEKPKRKAELSQFKKRLPDKKTKKEKGVSSTGIRLLEQFAEEIRKPRKSK